MVTSKIRDNKKKQNNVSFILGMIGTAVIVISVIAVCMIAVANFLEALIKL